MRSCPLWIPCPCPSAGDASEVEGGNARSSSASLRMGFRIIDRGGASVRFSSVQRGISGGRSPKTERESGRARAAKQPLTTFSEHRQGFYWLGQLRELSRSATTPSDHPLPSPRDQRPPPTISDQRPPPSPPPPRSATTPPDQRPAISDHPPPAISDQRPPSPTPLHFLRALC